MTEFKIKMIMIRKTFIEEIILFHTMTQNKLFFERVVVRERMKLYLVSLQYVLKALT